MAHILHYPLLLYHIVLRTLQFCHVCTMNLFSNGINAEVKLWMFEQYTSLGSFIFFSFRWYSTQICPFIVLSATQKHAVIYGYLDSKVLDGASLICSFRSVTICTVVQLSLNKSILNNKLLSGYEDSRHEEQKRSLKAFQIPHQFQCNTEYVHFYTDLNLRTVVYPIFNCYCITWN